MAPPSMAQLWWLWLIFLIACNLIAIYSMFIMFQGGLHGSMTMTAERKRIANCRKKAKIRFFVFFALIDTALFTLLIISIMANVSMHH